jgi:dedicator of cytokinesis protein 3
LTSRLIFADVHVACRLLESYREFQNPASQKAVERTRPLASSKPTTPVTFPESYPFSLTAYLPEVPKGVHNNQLTRTGDSLFNPGLGETAIVFLVLVLSSPKKHILNFLESSLDIEGRDRFVSLLS